MKRFFTYLFVLTMLNITGFTQEVNSCYREIDDDDLKSMIESEDPIILDVRLYMSYKKERIHHAQNAPNTETLKELLKNVDKNSKIVVYCKEGIRSKMVAKIICEELEFTNVFSLNKGFSEWKKRGYPIDDQEL